CGFRMHPSWFRIGGVAADLPDGWDRMIRDFLKWMPPRLREYEKIALDNRILRARTVGIGALSTEEAIDWGVTGPNLRATGFDWDFRKKRPYSGYEQFEFDVPIAQNGDCFDRCVVRAEEIRQSLRIIEQCVNDMPPGEYKSRHKLTTPPIKDRTMHDIETLIHHFLNVSWGPVMPPGESHFNIEGTKGAYGYYVISDGGPIPYRVRIRTAAFPHLQMLPLISRGLMIADLIAILGCIDFVMADVDPLRFVPRNADTRVTIGDRAGALLLRPVACRLHRCAQDRAAAARLGTGRRARRDRGAARDVRRRARRRRDVLQPDLSPPCWPPRRAHLRQRELLANGRRR